MKNNTVAIVLNLSSIYAELMQTGTFVSGGIQCAKCGTINTPSDLYCVNKNCGASWIESSNFDILQDQKQLKQILSQDRIST